MRCAVTIRSMRRHANDLSYGSRAWHTSTMFWTPVTRVVAARFISRTGGEAAFFVGIWGKLAFELDGDATAIAIVLGVAGVASLIGSAVAGALVDRHGPKAVLIGAEILFVPATLSVLFVNSPGTFTLAVAMMGLTGPASYTAIASLPPFLTSDEGELIRMNSLIEGAGMAAFITGPAAGGALVVWASLDAIFILDAVTSVIAVAIVITLPIIAHHAERPRRSGIAEIRAGFALAWNNHRLRFYLGSLAALWLVFGLFTALEPLFFRDVLGVGPEALGWINSIFGLGLVAGTIAASRWGHRLDSARGVVTLLALNGLGTILYVSTSIVAVVAMAGLIWGTLIGLFAPVVRTMLHINSPPDSVGRIMGTSQAISEVAKLGPLAAAPALALVFGVQRSLAASGLVLIAIAALLWSRAKRLDATRTAPADLSSSSS